MDHLEKASPPPAGSPLAGSLARAVVGAVAASLIVAAIAFGAGRSPSLATPQAAVDAVDPNPDAVPIDLALAGTRFGMNVRLVHPPEYKLVPDYVDLAAENARRSGGSLELMDDFDAGFKGSDIVYAKSWGPLLVAKNDEEGAAIGANYIDWITDERRMALAAEDSIFMHPLPAERGVEVADAVIDGPHSVVYDEAENRLHVQKAVMALTMR